MYLHYILYVILLRGSMVVTWYLAARFKISKSPNVLLLQILIILNLRGKNLMWFCMFSSPTLTQIYILFLSVVLQKCKVPLFKKVFLKLMK